MGFEIIQERTTPDGTHEARWGDAAWRVIDEETGLPKVDETRFWRVVQQKGEDHYVWVELHQRNPSRKKKTWRGKLVEVEQPTSVLGSSVVEVDDSISERSILKSALYVLRNIEENLSREDVVRKLVGDYPPKSLKEVSGGDL